MSRLMKPRSLQCNSRNIKGCYYRLRVNRDLAEELKKDKHDRKKPSEHEQDLKSWMTLKIY